MQHRSSAPQGLPAEYTAGQLVHALDRGARVYAGSPVYRVLLQLARWFPSFVQARMHASARRQLLPNPLSALDSRGRPTWRAGR